MKDKRDVFVRDAKCKKYDNTKAFNPRKIYPEALDLSIKSDPKIYDAIRGVLLDMKLDKKHIGTKTWNPFSDFLKSGDVVIVKPNLVKHINIATDGDTDALITNFSVLRPIIDYAVLAVGKSGKVIVGDAPVQECIFQEVIKLNGLDKAVKKYTVNGWRVELVDFRSHDNPNLASTIVHIDDNSMHCETDAYARKYAITNYDLRKIHAHHHDGIHEYLIPDIVLKADAIINVPKPKVHRKAGMTACMKNFVGINSLKEYLPHHRNGSLQKHGDEFPENSLLKTIQSNVKNYTYTKSFAIQCLNSFLCRVERMMHMGRFLEGSWYGNDTIWRTILDINMGILYADINGNLQPRRQRTILNIADMIVSGEKEGPLMPSNKGVGLIVASFNQLTMDEVICRIMGFEPARIKYLKHGYAINKYPIAAKNNYKVIYDGNTIQKDSLPNKHFIPTDGWADFLLDNQNLN